MKDLDKVFDAVSTIGVMYKIAKQNGEKISLSTLKEVGKQVADILEISQEQFSEIAQLVVRNKTKEEIKNIILHKQLNTVSHLEQEIISEIIAYYISSKKADGKSLEKISQISEQKWKKRKALLDDMIEQTTQEYSPDYNPEDDFELGKMWYELEFPFSEKEKKYFCMKKLESIKKAQK